jgi:hypothetical protein
MITQADFVPTAEFGPRFRMMATLHTSFPSNGSGVTTGLTKRRLYRRSSVLVPGTSMLKLNFRLGLRGGNSGRGVRNGLGDGGNTCKHTSVETKVDCLHPAHGKTGMQSRANPTLHIDEAPMREFEQCRAGHRAAVAHYHLLDAALACTGVAADRMYSIPPMNGRSGSGTSTEPSA